MASAAPSLPPGERLLESLLFTPADGYFLLEAHLARLQASAQVFTVPCETAAISERLQGCASMFDRPRKVRLLVAARGEIEITDEDVKPSTPVRAALAAHPVDSGELFLKHKTTVRGVYDRALASVRELGCQDVLLWNERGELTESATANLVLQIDGMKYTPPLRCGLLAGTYRSALLAAGELREEVLSVDLLAGAEAVWLVNSVRKWVVVECLLRPA